MSWPGAASPETQRGGLRASLHKASWAGVSGPRAWPHVPLQSCLLLTPPPHPAHLPPQGQAGCCLCGDHSTCFQGRQGKHASPQTQGRGHLTRWRIWSSSRTKGAEPGRMSSGRKGFMAVKLMQTVSRARSLRVEPAKSQGGAWEAPGASSPTTTWHCLWAWRGGLGRGRTHRKQQGSPPPGTGALASPWSSSLGGTESRGLPGQRGPEPRPQTRGRHSQPQSQAWGQNRVFTGAPAGEGDQCPEGGMSIGEATDCTEKSSCMTRSRSCHPSGPQCSYLVKWGDQPFPGRLC